MIYEIPITDIETWAADIWALVPISDDDTSICCRSRQFSNGPFMNTR